MHSDARLTPRATPVPPLTGRWRIALVEAGVIDSVQQLGKAMRAGAVTITARGSTATGAAAILREHHEYATLDTREVPDGDLVVVLADALGPRAGTVVCDIVIPRPLGTVVESCRDAVRLAAETHIPIVLLRRAVLRDVGTLLSVMIAPDGDDPAYDVACATSQLIGELGQWTSAPSPS